MLNNYRVNFGGDEIDYRDNFKDCRQYFPILEKLYALMDAYAIRYSWHFFEPYVEFTWVCEHDAPGDTAVGEAILTDVLDLLKVEGIEPTLVHHPANGQVAGWYHKSPEELEFEYRTYATSARMAMLFWEYREIIEEGCGEKNQYMRRPHVLANQIGMNYAEEGLALHQRAHLAKLFWQHGHEEAVKRYEATFGEKYL